MGRVMARVRAALSLAVMLAGAIAVMTARDATAAFPTESVRLCLPPSPLRVWTATSPSDLPSLIAAARPGDRIELASGTWAPQRIVIAAAGTVELPVELRAATAGGARFLGSGIALEIKGAGLVVSGLVLDGSTLLVNGASDVRVTRSQFLRTAATQAGVVVAGGAARVRVDHNLFSNSIGQGTRVGSLWLNATDQYHTALVPQVRIDQNHFRRFTGTGNGHKAIMLGRQEPTLFQARAESLVERNFFENVSIDDETISSKSSFNLIRQNTFRGGSRNSITLRSGWGTVVRENVLFGSDGIRVHGYQHVIELNYLQGTRTGIRLMSGNGDGTLRSIFDASGRIAHDRAWYTIVRDNTLIDALQPGVVLGCLPGSQTGLSCGATLLGAAIFEQAGTYFARNLVWQRAVPTTDPIRLLRGARPNTRGNQVWPARGYRDAGIVARNPAMVQRSDGRWVRAPGVIQPGAPDGLTMLGASSTGIAAADRFCP